ncbi:hypothetical protein U1Q18_023775 [Sarracenia purpurea var. burkii]
MGLLCMAEQHAPIGKLGKPSRETRPRNQDQENPGWSANPNLWFLSSRSGNRHSYLVKLRLVWSSFGGEDGGEKIQSANIASIAVPVEKNPRSVLSMTDLMVCNRNEITRSLQQRGQERLTHQLEEKAPNHPGLYPNLVLVPQPSSSQSRSSGFKSVPPQRLLGR